MIKNRVELTPQEKQWILERRVTRLTDNNEVQIYPMGAERYLYHRLGSEDARHYDIHSAIEGKNVLLIPGHGTSCFYFLMHGAQSVTIYDKDPITIAWVKAYKKYFHFREGTLSEYPSVGELIMALTRWYPPYIHLPLNKRLINRMHWLINPNGLRRVYVHYLVSMVQQAVSLDIQEDFEYEGAIQYFASILNKSKEGENHHFDVAFIPYLLGVKNGIETEEHILKFIKIVSDYVPTGKILITPSLATKEFFLCGKRYFSTTGRSSLASIPKLHSWIIEEDKTWFRTQGLLVLGKPSNLSTEQ